MRVTNGMLVTNAVWNIGKNTERLSEASERQSTQSKISLPSDDPVVATNAVKYRNYVSTVKQYQENASDAASWMKVTESAVSDLNDVVQEIREKTVQAANGTQSEQSLSAIKDEIEQLKQSAVDVLNTSYAGRYVFAGYNAESEPYALKKVTLTKADGTSVEINAVTYKNEYVNLGSVVSEEIAADYGSGSTSSPSATSALGTLASDYTAARTVSATIPKSTSETNIGLYNYSAINAQEISYNIGYGSQIQVNVEGQEVVGITPGSTLFDTIDKILLALDGETSCQSMAVDASTGAVSLTETKFTLSGLLADVDVNIDQMLAVTADLGARESYVTLAKNRLSDDSTVYTKLMSNNEDVDVATATTDLSSAQTVYEASLTVGAKAMTKSLLDFIS